MALTLASRVTLLAVALLLAPTARAGAVFEIREEVTTDPNNFKYQFGVGDGQTTSIAGAGTIKRSGGVGAGAFFRTSNIPLAVFTLDRCAAVAPHVHPNAMETLFVVSGKIRVHQFRGEEAGSAVVKYDLIPGQAGVIQQGAYHMVENIAPGKSQFLQIFDHPQGGANFAAPALVALRGSAANVVNSAFNSDIIGGGTTAGGALIKVRQCGW